MTLRNNKTGLSDTEDLFPFDSGGTSALNIYIQS